MNPPSSWVSIPSDSGFSLQNLPYGVFQYAGRTPHIGVAIGDFVLDLGAIADLGFLGFMEDPKKIFQNDCLNDFITLGKTMWSRLRAELQSLLSAENDLLKPFAEKIFIPRQEVEMKLPVRIGDYTDFYSSLEHATNVGTIFRGSDKALMPNWKHLPVAYHGRSSSIVVSGTPIRRPKGQWWESTGDNLVFGPTRNLDFELETAFIIGRDSNLGQSVSIEEAEDYIFGMVLVNDWSARDIQRWEYQPLGPFLGKNFATSISPWVLTMDALKPFKVPGPIQEPPLLPYLAFTGLQNYDIHLEVGITPPNGTETIVCRSNSKYLYWNHCQQLAHHTINGCKVRVGDLMASGTISGPGPHSSGSLLELTHNGLKPIQLSDESSRTFLEDHDTVTIRGWAEKRGFKVGFGEVSGMVLQSK